MQEWGQELGLVKAFECFAAQLATIPVNDILCLFPVVNHTDGTLQQQSAAVVDKLVGGVQLSIWPICSKKLKSLIDLSLCA